MDGTVTLFARNNAGSRGAAAADKGLPTPL
jgi:hypothetical protein